MKTNQTKLPIADCRLPIEKQGAFRTFLKIANRKSQIVNAFTLVELLTVIAIIAILAALLLPVLSAAKTRALKIKAQTEISGIRNAIEQYDSQYSRLPVSKETLALANNADLTFGGTLYIPGTITPSPMQIAATNGAAFTLTNSEIMAILMDRTNEPDEDTTVNVNYQYNPQQTIFLAPKMSGWSPGPPMTAPTGGVDNDLVYRDPWGNPYIITLDLNYDGMCKDSVYCCDKVSHGGLNGLTNPDGSSATTDNWQYNGKVMVWSAGPDGKANTGNPANADENKDNIISW